LFGGELVDDGVSRGNEDAATIRAAFESGAKPPEGYTEALVALERLVTDLETEKAQRGRARAALRQIWQEARNRKVEIEALKIDKKTNPLTPAIMAVFGFEAVEAKARAALMAESAEDSDAVPPGEA
jgi:hypothetical protein